MSLKVFVTSTRCCLGPFEPFPIPWQSQPSSLAYEVFQMCANLECLRSWRYCSDWPEVLLRTSIAKLWRNLSGYLCWASWDGVMALAMFAVCKRVRLEMGAVSIVLCTLGGAQSMKGNLDHVRHAIGFSGFAVGISVIGMSGGFGMTTLRGDMGSWYSWGRCIGRRIERGWARVYKGVARGVFTCGGLLLVVQRWIS